MRRVAGPAGLDALLHGGSLGFAIVVATTSGLTTHRLWAMVAAPAYALGLAASLWLARAAPFRTPSSLERARARVLAAVLVGAVILPLAVAVVLRAERGVAFTHDEVITTERAAVSLLHGDSPYDHSTTPADAEPRRFPYLPLMATFGVPRAVAPSWGVADARLWFLLASVVLVASALAAWSPPASRAIRVVQVTFALPTSAMGAVAGGHDLVVQAAMLLALAMLHRGSPAGAALAASCAGLLKATAWPLWIVLAVPWVAGACRGVPSDRHSGCRAAGCGLAILPAGLLAMLAWDGPGLLADTVLFPMGLADRQASSHPATWQDLALRLGHGADLAQRGTWLAAAAAAVAVGAVLAGGHGGERLRTVLRPGTARRAAVGAAALSGCILLVAGPSARPGLLAYPLCLLAWGGLLAQDVTRRSRLDPTPGGARVTT